MTDTEGYRERAPERIEISRRVYAVRSGASYFAFFPYDADASEIMTAHPRTHFMREVRGWHMPGNPRRVTEALTAIDQMLRAKGMDTDMEPTRKAPAKKPDRLLVPLSDGVAAGDILETKKGPVTVDRLGTPFTADRRFGRWGRPELVGQMVRYAYHHPSTEAEIRAASEPEAETEPSP